MQSISRTARPRRALTPAQKAVAPLAPIFAAASKKGLSITPENKVARLYAVNRLFSQLPEGFDWIETSFKDLLGNTAAIVVVADAIEGGTVAW
jgi:hypothetical protein